MNTAAHTLVLSRWQHFPNRLILFKTAAPSYSDGMTRRYSRLTNPVSPDAEAARRNPGGALSTAAPGILGQKRRAGSPAGGATQARPTPGSRPPRPRHPHAPRDHLPQTPAQTPSGWRSDGMTNDHSSSFRFSTCGFRKWVKVPTELTRVDPMETQPGPQWRPLVTVNIRVQ